MANLLTEKQKKEVEFNYLIRLFSASLLMLSLLGIFILAYVLPYYLSINAKDRKIGDTFKPILAVENSENIGQSSTQTVMEITDEMKVIEFYNSEIIVPSLYFNKILENKNSDIKINKISFGPVKNGMIQIFVGGVSKSRDSLVTFIDNLKTKAGFARVEYPISDFAKSQNISFNLDIKINK